MDLKKKIEAYHSIKSRLESYQNMINSSHDYTIDKTMENLRKCCFPKAKLDILKVYIEEYTDKFGSNKNLLKIINHTPLQEHYLKDRISVEDLIRFVRIQLNYGNHMHLKKWSYFFDFSMAIKILYFYERSFLIKYDLETSDFDVFKTIFDTLLNNNDKVPFPIQKDLLLAMYLHINEIMGGFDIQNYDINKVQSTIRNYYKEFLTNEAVLSSIELNGIADLDDDAPIVEFCYDKLKSYVINKDNQQTLK